MADTPPDPSGASDETPANAPVSPSADDIQRMVDAQIEQVVSKRISGLQSVYDKQLADARKQIDELKSDPDGYAASTNAQLEQELQAANRRLAALETAKNYPEVFPVYESILGADSPEAQLEILQAFVRGNPSDAPAQEAETSPSQETQSQQRVDPNRPLSTPPAGTAEVMDGATAQAILDQFQEWPNFEG